MFKSFPDRPFKAKEMDFFISGKGPAYEHSLYVTSENYVTFGESTTRGEMTKNCVESFRELKIALPDLFEISNTSIQIGFEPKPIVPKLKNITTLLRDKLGRMKRSI